MPALATHNKEISITKPIIYGNMSFWLGKKADAKASHKWVCYIRGVDNEDLTYFIKKVVFTLHPSFKNPMRTVTSFPFEIHEMGWGEFDISIKIYFIEEFEKPIEIFHPLKLHPTQPNALQSTKKPVVSEFYDELVFLNPSEKFLDILNTPPKISNKVSSLIRIEDDNKEATLDADTNLLDNDKNMMDYSQFFIKFDKTQDTINLTNALAFIQSEVKNLKEKIVKTDEVLTDYYREVGLDNEKKIN